MEKLTSSVILRTVKEYGLMAAGMFIYAFAWVGVLIPAEGTGGGASGLALLIYYATGGEAGGGIPIGISVLIINAVLLIIAAFIIGWKFGIKTIYCVVLLSVAMSAMQEWLPSDLIGLGEDKFLSAILGGVMAGIGVSLCFAQGGSTGGTDIVAMIINKYRTISYGRIVFFSDFIIIGSAYFIFRDVATIIYGYVMVATFGYTVDLIVAGNRQSSQMFIISSKYDMIADRVAHDAHRGVTLIDGEGWYSKHPMKIVMVVCRKNETRVMFRIIKECDPDAFITVGSVMGVYGKGFDALKK